MFKVDTGRGRAMADQALERLWRAHAQTDQLLTYIQATVRGKAAEIGQCVHELVGKRWIEEGYVHIVHAQELYGWHFGHQLQERVRRETLVCCCLSEVLDHQMGQAVHVEAGRLHKAVNVGVVVLGVVEQESAEMIEGSATIWKCQFIKLVQFEFEGSHLCEFREIDMRVIGDIEQVQLSQLNRTVTERCKDTKTIPAMRSGQRHTRNIQQRWSDCSGKTHRALSASNTN